MSIFVCEVLADGIVFTADKNVTITKIDGHGNCVSTVQDLGSKILRWPERKALLGYVGCAQVGSQTMYDWLYDFMGEHIAFTNPAVVANDMRDRLQREIGGPYRNRKDARVRGSEMKARKATKGKIAREVLLQNFFVSRLVGAITDRLYRLSLKQAKSLYQHYELDHEIVVTMRKGEPTFRWEALAVLTPSN